MPRRRVQFRKGESLFHAIVIPTDCDPGLGPANAICPGRNYWVKGTEPRSYGYRLGLPSVERQCCGTGVGVLAW